MRQSNKVYDAFACIEAGDKLKSFTKDSLKTAWKHKGRRHGIAVYPAFRLAVGMACLLFASALGAGGYAMLLEPVSCVSIDVNPSIELSLNRIDRVISARAYNADGEAVLNALSVKGMYYTDAVDKVVESEAMQPYLWEKAGLSFTVASDSGDRELVLLSGLENTSGCRKHGGVGYEADFRALEAAHESGLSLGKYTAYQTLAQYDDTITAQDCHNMSMSEIHGLIEEHEHGHGEEHGTETGYDREEEQGEEEGHDIMEEHDAESGHDMEEAHNAGAGHDTEEEHNAEPGHDMEEGHNTEFRDIEGAHGTEQDDTNGESATESRYGEPEEQGNAWETEKESGVGGEDAGSHHSGRHGHGHR